MMKIVSDHPSKKIKPIYYWPKVFDEWLSPNVGNGSEEYTYSAKQPIKPIGSKVQGFQNCVFCPDIIKSSDKFNATDKITGLTMTIRSHLNDNHKHLMFECRIGECNLANDLEYAYIPNEDTEVTRYFVSHEALLEHMNVYHNDMHSVKARISLPPDSLNVDLRKATCNVCKKVFLCQGYYNLEKHSRLAHVNEKIQFDLACRICNYTTNSCRSWRLHFEGGYKRCLNYDSVIDSIKPLTKNIINFQPCVKPLPLMDLMDPSLVTKKESSCSVTTNDDLMNNKLFGSKLVTNNIIPIGAIHSNQNQLSITIDNSCTNQQLAKIDDSKNPIDMSYLNNIEMFNKTIEELNKSYEKSSTIAVAKTNIIPNEKNEIDKSDEKIDSTLRLDKATFSSNHNLQAVNLVKKSFFPKKSKTLK